LGLKREGDFYGQEVLYSRANYQEVEGSRGNAGQRRYGRTNMSESWD